MANKTALIPGSSSGLGLLTSIELAKAGYRVLATMRDLSKRKKLDHAAAAAGVADKIGVRALDVTRSSEIATVVDTVARDYGHIDVLVNNADSP
jgi:NAD(P)-dependent dehydrogenase (short-subunit alcohol dehydrogenase family)